MPPVNPTRRPARITGIAMITLALAFNLPYARLAATFDYPVILRQPPETILAALAEGGPALIATWYAFAACALIFAPLAMAQALGQGRAQRVPALASAAAIAGAFAGILQAMGLLRWVLVMPALAGMPDAATTFTALHAMGGAVIGEHLGQLATALHVGLMAAIHRDEGHRALPIAGGLTAALITLGSFETPALALGLPGNAFALAAIAGYLALTLWLILAGLAMIRR